MNIRPCIIILQNDKLLTLRYNYSGNFVYALPGGNLEFGEKMKEALKRELEEEVGLEVKVKELAFVAEVHQEKKETLHMVFNGEILNGQPVLNPLETSAEAVVWLPMESLESKSLYPNIGLHLLKCEWGPSTQFLGEIYQPWF